MHGRAKTKAGNVELNHTFNFLRGILEVSKVRHHFRIFRLLKLPQKGDDDSNRHVYHHI